MQLYDLSIDDLELSVRTVNVLRRAEIRTIGEFLALDKATVTGLPNAGARTWNEIRETQDYLNRQLTDKLKRLVGELNKLLLQRSHSLKVTVDNDGLVKVYQWYAPADDPVGAALVALLEKRDDQLAEASSEISRLQDELAHMTDALDALNPDIESIGNALSRAANLADRVGTRLKKL
jgi:phage-related tail protein